MNITAVDNIVTGSESPTPGADDKERQAKLLRFEKACQQFESLFIYYMLKTMRAASEKSSLLDEGFGSDIFMQMFDEGLADKMAEAGPFGLGNQLYDSYIKYIDKSADKSPPVQLSDLAVRKPAVRVTEGSSTKNISGSELDAYDDIVNEAAGANGLNPGLVKAVILQESGGNPKAVSSKGAKGLMQLMDGTARMLGITDPFDVRQNIFGGAKYLASLLKKFDGDLKSALAAYNAGPMAVLKYGGVPPYDETKKYINGVLNILKGLL
jgi:soluble lytic murein transglycosylase-like protein